MIGLVLKKVRKDTAKAGDASLTGGLIDEGFGTVVEDTWDGLFAAGALCVLVPA